MEIIKEYLQSDKQMQKCEANIVGLKDPEPLKELNLKRRGVLLLDQAARTFKFAAFTVLYAMYMQCWVLMCGCLWYCLCVSLIPTVLRLTGRLNCC